MRQHPRYLHAACGQYAARWALWLILHAQRTTWWPRQSWARMRIGLASTSWRVRPACVHRRRARHGPAACSAAQARGVPRPNSTSSPAQAAPKPTTSTRTGGSVSMPGRSVRSIRSRSATIRAIASNSSARGRADCLSSAMRRNGLRGL